MEGKKQWDFECPQYVDFRAGLDSNAEDVFFDCTDNFSPGVDKAWKNLPAPANGLTEEDENKLIDKMTAALSILENTPKIKPNVLRGKLFSEKAPAKYIGAAQQAKPIAKSATVYRPSVKKRSKSVCDPNKVHTEKHIKTKAFRPKRSSSLGDLRVMKKHTYPKTPLCLKRTINAKHKVLKTTEEMELEQIALLQKQLAQLLRNNEISYNKIKRRQKPYIQNMESKLEMLKGNADTNTDKNMRQNIHAKSHAALRQTTLKLDGIINSKESTHKTPRNICRDILEKSKNPSVSSSILSEDFDRSRDQVPKKHVNVKYGFHSGLVFTTKSCKSSSSVKPFIFETKIKEMKAQNTCTNQKNEVSLTRSVSNDDVNKGKENIPVTKPKSAVKNFTYIQKMKIDAKVLAANKKKIGQPRGNPVRAIFLRMYGTDNHTGPINVSP